MKKIYTTPKYVKIALDIAYSIKNGDLVEGSKVSGRSTLASKYNVSPETIRRSIALLRDSNVVDVSEKSGIQILSSQQADVFIENFKTKDSVLKLNNETHNLMSQKEALETQILGNIKSIIEYSVQLKNIGVIYTLELEIPTGSHIINKSIGDVRFWKKTHATIVGIKRNGKTIVSPGPHTIFEEDDTILFVGDDGVMESVRNYIAIHS